MLLVRRNPGTLESLFLIGVAVLLIRSRPAFAKHDELNAIEQMRKADESLRTIDELKASLEALTKPRNDQCMLSTGTAKLCACLDGKLPLDVDTFATYIAIATYPDSELAKHQSEITEEQRKLIGNTRQARDYCTAFAAGRISQKQYDDDQRGDDTVWRRRIAKAPR